MSDITKSTSHNMTRNYMVEQKQSVTEERIEIARAAACIMVILIHSSTPFVLGGVNTPAFFLANIIDSFCRPAVPIFLMVSGFLILDRPSIALVKSYQQTFHRILIPLSTWTVIYTIFDGLRNGFNYKITIEKIISGNTYYHFWYLYMILGLSIFLPFIVRGWILFDKIERFIIVVILMIIALSSSIYYQFFPVNTWLLIGFIPFTGYYLFGSVGKHISINIRPLIVFSIYVISASAGAAATLYTVKLYNNFYFYDYLSATTIISSTSLFIWLTRGPLKRSSRYISFISKNSFFIYMMHPILLAVVIRILFSANTPAEFIPVFALISLLGSSALGEILSRTPIRIFFGYR